MSDRQSMIRVGVLLAPTSGTRPTEADLNPDYYALAWGVSAGSGLWWATIAKNLGLAGERLVDMSLTVAGTRQVELWQIGDGDTFDRLLFWGEIVSTRLEINPGAERQVLTARMMPYHLGRLDGPRFYNVGVETTFPLAIEFNPEIDGKTCNNRQTIGSDDFWIDPESVRTDNAKEYQAGTIGEWTAETATKRLLTLGNAAELWIDNPSDYTLTDAADVRNVVLPWGKWTAFYLDEVLQAHGHNWWVDNVASGEGSTWKPQVVLYKQGTGTAKTLKMANGGQFDFSTTNTTGLDVSIDVSALSNKVIGYGAREEIEVTVPLYRSWAATEDGNEDHADNANPIGRKFVANEAGDYTDVRTEITGPAILNPDWLVRRRVAEECIELRDGQRIPPVLEYSVDSGGTWSVVPEGWGYRLLTSELGIYFTGEGSPAGIPEPALDTDTLFRLTCTVRGDKRLKYEADLLASSPNGNELALSIDLSDRFFDRSRQATGDFASVLTGTSTDSLDDETPLSTYIETVAANAQVANIQGTASLPGLKFTEYKIGDVITKIEGREISLNRSTSGASPKYPQIVGITWRNDGKQTTDLTFNSQGVAPDEDA